MKTWILDSLQHINVDHHRNVHFKHFTRKGYRGITLSWRQFRNLNDIIMDLETFYKMKYYPLGDHIWFQFCGNRIQIYHSKLSIYFTFRDACWKKYKREIHRRLLSFLQHEWKALHHRQHTPSHENLFEGRSQNITSTTRKQQVLPRTTSNVSDENEQWEESSNLSKWDGANHRQPFSFIGAIHALRTPEKATSDMEEGEVFDNESECGQLSDFCTIE